MNNKTSVFGFILKQLSGFKWSITLMFVVALVWAIDLSLRPYLIKLIIDKVSCGVSASLWGELKYLLLVYLGVTTSFITLFRLYGYFVEIKMLPNLKEKLANYAMQQLLKQSPAFYQHQLAGSLANRVNELLTGVPEIVQIVVDRFCGHFFALVFAIASLWQVNWRFAVAMLVTTSLFVLISWFLSYRVNLYSVQLSALNSKITGHMVDVLANMLSVWIFARDRYEFKRFSSYIADMVSADRKMQWAYFWIWFYYGYAFVILQAVCLYFLIQGRIAGTISVGDFALVLMLNISIIDFLWQLAPEFSLFSKYFGKVRDALNILLLESEINDIKAAKDLVITKGQINFQQVNFHYKGGLPLFINLNLTISAGQKIGLVGYSGSGKSSLVSLLLRLYDIQAGQILIDQQDIKTVKQASLRSQLGLIPQEALLFNRTVLENIRYAKPDATDYEVIAAAKQAKAHDFIMQLPQGYDTRIGERGVKLSGGQKQRLAISRVILKDPPIIIMDEATSQLDSLTESELQETFTNFMATKTTIVIAHRLSTLLYMDKLLVFKQGEIVEAGSHQELLAQNGLYAKMWSSQIEGLLPT